MRSYSNLFDYRKTLKIKFILYVTIVLFIVFYFLFLQILSLSIDILIGFNLICLFFIGYLFFSDWLNNFFEYKIKRLYVRIMKLFFLLDNILLLNLNVYESFFNLFKVSFIFFNEELKKTMVILKKSRNMLLKKFYVNIFMKYFFLILQMKNNYLFYLTNDFYFINFRFVKSFYIFCLNYILLK